MDFTFLNEISIVEYILFALFIYAANLTVYASFNKGMLEGSVKKQAKRMLKVALLSTLPIAIAQIPIFSPIVIFNTVATLYYGASYPIVSQIGNGKEIPKFGHYVDIVFGTYLLGWIISVKTMFTYIPALVTVGDIFVGIVLFIFIMTATIQWTHYIVYKVSMDENSLQAVLDTDKAEAKEFLKSFHPIALVGIVVAVITLLFICLWGEGLTVSYAQQNNVALIFSVIWSIYTTKHLFFGRKSFIYRIQIFKQWHEIQVYRKRIKKYRKNLDERLARLQAEQAGTPCEEPHTYILVIGESASRDYMSAFTQMEQDTTPWLRTMGEDSEHNIIFPNAYSCALQTVPTLERALTEVNQYNDKEFQESVSIVDIAHKAGYNVHWYSNQGYIGTYDTSITLVANSSDTAKWVSKEYNQILHDEALLNLLAEVDATKNNFVVLHFMGSHYNFLNRYPAEATVWGEKGVEDHIPNYLNSIRYSDEVLKKIYEYGREKLNLQAMIYFSDHACIPDERRSPQFAGFGMLRIPLAVLLTDSYISRHKERYNALKANKEKYFTNDLMYELFCGVLDIKSNHFDTSNSLAHAEYKYTRDMLFTNCGKTAISDDKSN